MQPAAKRGRPVDHDVSAVEAVMHRASDYKTWSEAALELDRLDGLDDWKAEEASDHYDWRLIRSRLRQIRSFRAEGQTLKLVHHLRQGLHWNLGNIGNSALYKVARIGTKKLISDYVSEVCDALNELASADIPEFSQNDKHKFFHDVALSYGRSALMLSGGATLGLFHVGVVRALYREGVLPEVMSGSSAGSIVAATVGIRGDTTTVATTDSAGRYSIAIPRPEADLAHWKEQQSRLMLALDYDRPGTTTVIDLAAGLPRHGWAVRVASMRPMCVSPEDIPAGALEEERQVVEKQVAADREAQVGRTADADLGGRHAHLGERGLGATEAAKRSGGHGGGPHDPRATCNGLPAITAADPKTGDWVLWQKSIRMVDDMLDYHRGLSDEPVWRPMPPADSRRADSGILRPADR